MNPSAVIDLGTNSVKVLVADGATELFRDLEMTRLGEGLAATGTLSTAAIERTAAAVAGFAATARSLGARDVSIVGTAACRRASNTDTLSAEIDRRCGLSLEVLSAHDEAALSFTGALHRLPLDRWPALVVDIGGGSTEFALGSDTPAGTWSIPFGAVSATETHLGTDPPAPADLTNLIGAVRDEIEDICRESPAFSAPHATVGIAGTILTVAAVEIGQVRFDESALHGFVLTREAAEDVFRTLATEGPAERALNPGLPAERADIIVAGCCILVATMRHLGIERLTVSTGSLRDGVLARGRMAR